MPKTTEQKCPWCGGELFYHSAKDGARISEPMIAGYTVAGDEPRRRLRVASFWGCTECEYCIEA